MLKVCSHDSSPAIIEHLISATSNLPESGQPPIKRAKLSTSPTIASIAAKVQKKTYSSIEDFVSDVDRVCLEVLQSTRLKGSNVEGGTQWRYLSDSLEQDRTVANLDSFKKFFNSLLVRDTRQIKTEPSYDTHVDRQAERTEPDSDATVSDGRLRSLTTDTQDGRTVLTLFGNAQGHKQLFSSFQKSIPRVTATKDEQNGSFKIGSSELAVMPIRENGLPNGISSTKIVPLHLEDVSVGRPPGPTFGESFAPLATLPALSLPKIPQIPTARGSIITWAKGGANRDSPRKSGYSNEKLPAGHWLSYGGLALNEEPYSPEAKRKRRDRALSTGDAGLTPTEGAKASQLQSKEDALFRGVYSSFAPCRDDTSAIFPEEVKSQAWWYKTGQRCFEEAFPVNPGLLQHHVEGAYVVENNDTKEEEALFREAVEAFIPNTEILEPESEPVSDEDRDGGEILREISDMLGILHSHQRVRNSSIATISRVSTGQNPATGDLDRTPSTPSAVEIDTYNTLKAQFLILISNLPPYTVAKLNGQQLADLNINQHMLLDETDYRGIMEEDQVARLAKATALNAAVGTSTVARSMSATANTPIQGQYSVPQPRTAQMTQPSRTPAQQSYQPHASLTRPPSNTRQPLSSWQSPAQARQSGMQRPFYPQQESYTSLSQQNAKTMYSQLPRVPPASAPLSSYLPPTPGNFHQANGVYQSPSQPGYQQRAQSYGNYGSYPQNASSPKSASYDSSQHQAQYPQHPLLPTYQSPRPPPPALMQSQSRPSYLAQPIPPPSVHSTLSYNPNNPYPPNPIPANYATNTSNSAVTASASITSRPQAPSTHVVQQGSVSSAGLYPAISSDQPQTTMDKKSVQLAEPRRGSVGSVPGSIARSASGTPQPPLQR